MSLGHINKYTVDRETKLGYMLVDSEGREYFLHHNECGGKFLNSGDKVNAFITKDMHLEEEGFGIAKYFYLQNPLLAILSKYGLEGLLEYPSANSGIVLNLGLFA